jgi:hypothetical protein
VFHEQHTEWYTGAQEHLSNQLTFPVEMQGQLARLPCVYVDAWLVLQYNGAPDNTSHTKAEWSNMVVKQDADRKGKNHASRMSHAQEMLDRCLRRRWSSTTSHPR